MSTATKYAVWWPECYEKPIGKVEILGQTPEYTMIRLMDNPFNSGMVEVGETRKMYDSSNLVSLRSAANRMDQISLRYRNYGKGLLK